MPSRLSGAEAERVGHSIWNYIVQKYGRDNVSNILNLTRIIRNEQSSISSTLGVPYSRFLRESAWHPRRLLGNTVALAAAGTGMAGVPVAVVVHLQRHRCQGLRQQGADALDAFRVELGNIGLGPAGGHGSTLRKGRTSTRV